MLNGFQHPCAQRDVSTSATARESGESAQPSDSASEPEQAAADAKDVAKVVHANELRQLRRKWKAQHAQKLAIKAKADAKKTANKAVMIEGHRRNVAAMKELRGQIHEEKRRLQIAEMVRQILLKYLCHTMLESMTVLYANMFTCVCMSSLSGCQHALMYAGTTASSCGSI